MDADFRLLLPGAPMPRALEDWLAEDYYAALEGRRSVFGDGDVIPVYRAESPDVAGELWAVGEMGGDPLALFFLVDVGGRVLMVSTVDPSWNGAPAGDPGDFLDWACRRTVRMLVEDRPGVPMTAEDRGGDPRTEA